MGFQTVFAGIAVAVFLLVPLSIKWEIRFKRSLTGALAIGSIAGLITSATSNHFYGMGFAGIVSLEVFLVLGITSSSVALMFYRDPERRVSQKNGVIVSPADGSIIYIKEIERGEVPLSIKKGNSFKLEELTQTDLIKDGGYLIGIGMNLLNVHVNRAPIGGRVEMINHVNGQFLSLKAPEAVLANERLTTIIDNGLFKVGVVQIASRLVRRIETYLTENQAVEMGQRIGMIKFGSQVDIVIPKLGNNRIRVHQGAEVVAGISILAEYGDDLDCKS